MFGRKPSRFNGYSLLSLIVGGIAGASVALLYAPTTGRKLQKKLQKQLKHVIEDQVGNVQTIMKRVAT